MVFHFHQSVGPGAVNVQLNTVMEVPHATGSLFAGREVSMSIPAE